MKIVPASYEIIEPMLARLSMEQRIEYCGRICYKSEDKIDAESAIPFCKKMIASGHLAVMEMGRIHLVLNDELGGLIALSKSKYLMCYKTVCNEFIISGSPRAFLEYWGAGAAYMRVFLAQKYPAIFYNSSDIRLSDIFSGYPIRYAEIPEIPYEHKYIAVKFIVNRAVTHELVRHRPCSFLQECLSGDTVVRSFLSNKSWSMRQLYKIFNSPEFGLARKTIRIRTKDEYGEIVPSQIINVYKSGMKKIYRVTTKNGYSIKSSMNHIYFTENGEQRLKDISIGDKLWMNGKEITFEWLYEEYIIKNRERKELALEIGMSDSWLGKLIRSYGITKSKSDYPNRQAGHGNPGMHSKTGKEKISERMRGKNNHRWIGDSISDRGGYSRANSVYNITGELCCCGNPAVERHHIDRDVKNNNPENIEFCCIKCHQARHRSGVKIAWLDEIVSIEYVGLKMTYDLEVDHPAHNFSANNFIVHNSQRYCRYSGDKFGNEITFIAPTAFFPEYSNDYSIWKSAMENAEKLYFDLLANNTPQAARTVLPNSCKTEIIVYADVKEWKHIFSLRVPASAEPSMREVMIPLQEEMVNRGMIRYV